jgi:demethylmenaquinone methyltransferase/2-methoxy-6-polyprenyl-1,4-benzoquinol methylase
VAELGEPVRGEPLSKQPDRIAGMFDAIARRYDTLNHLLSAGLDRRWRRRGVRDLRLSERERVLDLCTGTADLAIEAATSRFGKASDVIGIDFAGEMLRLGVRKVRDAGLAGRIRLARGDAMRLPLADASCDAAMIAFGIRNVIDPIAALRELARTLRISGRLMILEFGYPDLPIIRPLYQWYFHAVLPRIGRLISKHGDAYAYLPASVAAFPSHDEFAALLTAAGFTSVRRVALTAGVVSLWTATRAPEAPRRNTPAQ